MTLSFFQNIILPQLNAGWNAFGLYDEACKKKDRTVMEKTDITVRFINLMLSYTDTVCSSYGFCIGTDKLTSRAKKIFMRFRTAAAASNLLSTGTSIMVKLEKGTASKWDLLNIVNIAIYEGASTMSLADTLYPDFAKKCVEKAPRLFPKHLMKEFHEQNIDIEEIENKIREIFQKRMKIIQGARMVVMASTNLAAKANKIASSQGWGPYFKSWFTKSSQPFNPIVSSPIPPIQPSSSDLEIKTTICGGNIVRHFSKPPNSLPQDEDAVRKRLIKLAARMAIQLFSYEETLAKKFKSDSALRIFICPITNLPIRTPVYVKKLNKLFDEEAIHDRLSQNPEGFSIIINGQNETIDTRDLIRRDQDAKSLQEAKNKALRELISRFSYQANKTSPGKEEINEGFSMIDLDEEARRLSMTVVDLKARLAKEMKKKQYERFLCCISGHPIEHCPIYIPSKGMLVEKRNLEKKFDQISGKYNFSTCKPTFRGSRHNFLELNHKF